MNKEPIFKNSKELVDSEILQFKGYSMFLRKDGIVQIQFEIGFEGGINEAKNMVDCIKKLSKGKPIPILVIYSDFNFFDNQARTYVASQEVSTIVKADALVINSAGLKIIGNIYLSINKPQRPTKIFTDENLALKWAKQFV